MTDYLIKEDVFMALTGDITDCTIEEFIARLRDKLSKLPSTTQKEKTGRWIFKNDNIAIPTGYYQCSECEKGKLLNEDNFCPNCGARMVSE